MRQDGVDLARATALRSGIGTRRRLRWFWLHCRRTLIFASVVTFAGIAAAIWMLARQPVSIDGLPERVAQGLEQKLGAGWDVRIGEATLSWLGFGPALDVERLRLYDPTGALVLSAPAARVGVDGFLALVGRFTPRAIVFEGVDLRLEHRPDGSIGLTNVPGEEPEVTAQRPAPPALGDQGLAVAIASIMGVFGGEEGPFGSIESASLTRSRLILIDRRHGERVAFDQIDLSVLRESDTRSRINLRVRGTQNAWSVGTLLTGRAGQQRRARVSLQDAALSDLLLLTGRTGIPVSGDTRVSGDIDAEISSENSLLRFEGGLRLTDGIVNLAMEGAKPVSVRDAGVRVVWDPEKRVFGLETTRFDIGGVRAELAGSVIPGRDETPWRMQLAAPAVEVAALDGSAPPHTYDQFRIDASFPDRASTLEAAMELGRGDARLALNVVAGLAPGSPHGLALRLDGSRISIREGLRLWPDHLAWWVRDYLLGSARAGMIEAISIRSQFDPESFDAALAGGKWPDKALRIDFALSDGVFAPGPGLPVLREADIAGVVTGTTASVTARSARIVEQPDATAGTTAPRAMSFTDASLRIDDTTIEPTPAHLTFAVSGGADAFIALLRSPKIREGLTIAQQPSAVHGEASARFDIRFPLQNANDPAAMQILAKGELRNLTIAKAIGAESIEGGNLTLSYGPAGLALRGDARVMGQNATVDLRQPKSGPGEATLGFMLDEAARARRGLDFGSALSGTLPVRVTTALAEGPSGRSRFEIDLTRAAIDGLVPGWTKPAGRAAKLSFVLTERPSGHTLLEDLVLDGSGLLARGQASLAADNSLESADFSSFKLSPGDDMRLKLERAGGVSKVTVRGTVVDARPFLQYATQGAQPRPATRGRASQAGEPPSFDLDLTTPILAGHNDESITGAEMKLSRRGGTIREFRLSGRFGSQPFLAELASQERESPVLIVRTGNGGAFLRYMDLYRRMFGGDLILSFTPFDARQEGLLQIGEFRLRNEPALRRILSQQPTGAVGGDSAVAQAPVVNPDEVFFTKLRAEFTRTGGRFDVREAVIWGPQVGLTIAGFVDNARDRTDLAGTYVPAYGLNNIFAQVPLFGPLLGGGQYGGLFAVNFRISGAASAPQLTINPLSAVAPGFLRRLFEAGRSDPTGFRPQALPER